MTRVGLEALSGYGFALAGGYALQAHQLVRLGAESDAGFSPGWFAEALAGVDRFADDEFVGYGVDHAGVAHVRETMRLGAMSCGQRLTDRPANRTQDCNLGAAATSGVRTRRGPDNLRSRHSAQSPAPGALTAIPGSTCDLAL